MKFGVSLTAIHRLFVAFFEFPAIEEAIIYGSRATGHYSTWSDIDITLKGKLLDDDALREIDSLLYAMKLPYQIDLTLYNQIDQPGLLQHIDQDGKTLYKRRNFTEEELLS